MKKENTIIIVTSLAIIGVMAFILLRKRKMKEEEVQVPMKPTKEEVGLALEKTFGVKKPEPTKQEIGLALENVFGVKKS